MATVKDAFAIARSLLGDDLGLDLTDIALMPKIILAHNEMAAKLVLNGLKPTRADVDGTVVLAGATTMTQPVDFLEPIKLTERAQGDTIDNASPMTEKEFLPEYVATETLRYWQFNKGDVIRFIGATTNRVIHLYYHAKLTAPAKVNDLLPIQYSESYLGPRVAALQVFKTDQALYESASAIAEEALSRIVRTAVKGDQLPVRRRPFSWALRNRRFY